MAGKVFENIQGTVNYCVDKLKYTDNPAFPQFSTSHKPPFCSFLNSLSKGLGPKWRRLNSISQRAWRERSLRLRCQAPSLPPEN